MGMSASGTLCLGTTYHKNKSDARKSAFPETTSESFAKRPDDKTRSPCCLAAGDPPVPDITFAIGLCCFVMLVVLQLQHVRRLFKDHIWAQFS